MKKNGYLLWHSWSKSTAFISIMLIGLLSGCCSKTTVVLLPEADGHVGKVTVKAQESSATLTQANESARVGAPGQPVKNTGVLNADQVQKYFGEALAARPLPPKVFLLYFKSGGAELTEESKALIPEIIESIRSRESMDIGVVGHTDRVGGAKRNWQLSIKRAGVVVDILGASGVDVSLVETTSHGENNPLIPTADGIAEPKNRRVEVMVR